MGSFFSRHKKTTVEILEKLEKDIASLEDFRKDTELKEKRIIGKLLVALIAAYFISLAVGYFYFFPKNPKEIALCLFLVVIIPVLIWGLKLGLRWYFKMRLENNSDNLVELRATRRKILDEVKETETYKVATEILEKFDPDTKLQKAAKERKEQEDKEREMMRRFAPIGSGPTPQTQVRRRLTVAGGQASPTTPQQNVFRTPTPGPAQAGATPMWRPPIQATPGAQGAILAPQMTPRLCRPILPRERGSWEKIVDYVIGDGPSNRFALICSQCHSHNGMAMKEDFEFLAFRCAYCLAFNPARKQRPNAPQVPHEVHQHQQQEELSQSSQMATSNQQRGRSSSESRAPPTDVDDSSDRKTPTIPEIDSEDQEVEEVEPGRSAGGTDTPEGDFGSGIPPGGAVGGSAVSSPEENGFLENGLVEIRTEEEEEELLNHMSGPEVECMESPSGNWEVVDQQQSSAQN